MKNGQQSRDMGHDNTLIVLFLAGVMGQQALRVWARMRGFLATTVKAIHRFYDRSLTCTATYFVAAAAGGVRRRSRRKTGQARSAGLAIATQSIAASHGSTAPTSAHFVVAGAVVVKLFLDDVVLRAIREMGDVLPAMLIDDQNIVLAIAARPGRPSGIMIIGSMEITMPGSSTVSMSSRSSSPASRP